VVRRLVARAKIHVPIETVLCDREFDSMRVFQTLQNLDDNSFVPKRITSTERDAIDQMEADGQDVAVETASVNVEWGSHELGFLYVPSSSGEGTAVFATGLAVGPEEAETFCRRYSRRWQIENMYKSLSTISSRRLPRRTQPAVVLLRLRGDAVQYLVAHRLPAESGRRRGNGLRARLTAGECIKLVSSALIPAD
jgi:hypothetical protein